MAGPPFRAPCHAEAGKGRPPDTWAKGGRETGAAALPRRAPAACSAGRLAPRRSERSVRQSGFSRSCEEPEEPAGETFESEFLFEELSAAETQLPCPARVGDQALEAVVQ